MHGVPADVVNVLDFERLARDRLGPGEYAYISGGSWDEATLRDNVDAFSNYALRPRVLVDVSEVDTTCELLGTRVAMPVALAPNALQRLAHPDGELATARAAARAGALMCLSTLSSRSMEEVAAAGGAPKWFQLYVHRDRAFAEDMVHRAVAAGYRALVVTADLPVPGYRERELRHPLTVEPGWFANLPPAASGRELIEIIDGIIDASLTWDDLAWVRELSDLPVVIKGVLTAEDAVLAVDHGASAIIVSNHGGRQLDRASATIDVLAEVVDAVAGGAEVYLDGGVRRGTDVAVALALGARAVFIGRPYLYALAVAGEDGVVTALRLLAAEFTTAMRLLGVTHPGALTRDYVALPSR